MTRWGKRSVETSVALRQRIPELDDLPPLTVEEERLFIEAAEKIKEIANRVKGKGSCLHSSFFLILSGWIMIFYQLTFRTT